MATLVLTGQDTIIVNDEVVTGLATGTVGQVTLENDIAASQTGKDGNSIIAYNASGKQATLELHIIRGCHDDKRFNDLFNQQKTGITNFVTLTGAVIKQLGDGKGNIEHDTTSLVDGFFLRGPDVQSNVEGDIAQAEVIWKFRFCDFQRVIG